MDVVEAGVVGGVVMLICRFLGLGDTELEIGDGMLYLKYENKTQ